MQNRGYRWNPKGQNALYMESGFYMKLKACHKIIFLQSVYCGDIGVACFYFE